MKKVLMGLSVGLTIIAAIAIIASAFVPPILFVGLLLETVGLALAGISARFEKKEIENTSSNNLTSYDYVSEEKEKLNNNKQKVVYKEQHFNSADNNLTK